MVYSRQRVLAAEADYNDSKNALNSGLYSRSSTGVIAQLTATLEGLREVHVRALGSYKKSLTVLVNYENKFDFSVEMLSEIRENNVKIKAEMAEIVRFFEHQRRYVEEKAVEVQSLVSQFPKYDSFSRNILTKDRGQEP